MLKVSKTSIGNVNPNCSTLTNAEKCRKYRENKKSKDDEYAKKERIRQQENRKRRTTKQIENDRIKSKIRMQKLRERRKKEKEPEMDLKLNVSNFSNSNKEQRKKWRKAKQKYRERLFNRNKDDIYQGKNQEESNSGDNGKQLNEKFGKGTSSYENVSPADKSQYKNGSLRFERGVNLSRVSEKIFDDTEKTYGSTFIESNSTGSPSEDGFIKSIFQDKIPSINNLYSISDPLKVKAFKFLVDFVNSRVPLNELVSNATVSPNLRIDNVSSKIIPDISDWESKIQDLYPVYITGDGNCLPRTGSVLAFGSEDRHEEIRKRIVVEMIKNRDQYLSLYHIATEEERQRLLNSFTMYSSRYTKVGKITDEVVRNVFDQEIMHIMQPNSHMGIWQICALATILNAPIASVYPERGLPEVQKDLHRIIRPLPIAENPACRMHYIMWTNTQNISTEKHWTPNHFVPLIPKENLTNSKHSDSSLSNTMSTHDKDTSNSDNNALVEDTSLPNIETSLPNIEDRNLCSTDDLYCPTESSRKITRTVTECSTVYAPPRSSIPLYTDKPFFSSQLQQRRPIIQGHQEFNDYNTKHSVPQVPRVGSLNSLNDLLPTFLPQPEIVSRQQTNNSFLHIPFTNQTGELPALGTSHGERYRQNLPHVEGIQMNDQRYSYGPQDETRDLYQLNEFPTQTRCPQTGNLLHESLRILRLLIPPMFSM